MEKPNDFDVNDLIEYLQGTCMTLDEGINDLYPDCDSMILTTDDHTAIDNEIFLCEDCDWWYEICEQSEDEPTKCKDCAGDDE